MQIEDDILEKPVHEMEVEIKNADRHIIMIAADEWIKDFGDDSVHTGKRTEIDHPVTSRFVIGNGFPCVEGHLSQSLSLRQIRSAAFQKLTHRHFLAPGK